MASIVPIKIERSCNGCTKCCDGWLTGTAHGHDFYPGKKCYWSGKNGCNIYEFRPHDPCVTFKCFWKTSRLVPNHFKPSTIGVIFVERYLDTYAFLDVNYGGAVLSNEVIDWLYKVFNENKIPHIRYRKDGKYRILSNDIEFVKLMENKLGKENLDR